MSLAARVCGFFLATLAVVLCGVSVTLYLLSSAHLHRDLDERLGLALDSLTTSVDVDPGRVEWNPGCASASAGGGAGRRPGVLAGGRPRGNDGRSNVGRGGRRPGGAGEACSERRGIRIETHIDRRGRSWRAALRHVYAGPVAGGIESNWCFVSGGDE